ncbi:conserved hypothetical protein [Pantoea sp. At-9b]|nr:conserved hypothetical protein [Pantoea sp. At-9b]
MNFNFIQEELGVEQNLPHDLVESSMKYVMAFYYSEDRFFNRNVQFRQSENYSSDILHSLKSDCDELIENTFLYFKNRYLQPDDANHRLYALTMSQDKENSPFRTLSRYLTQSESIEDKLTTCLMICIRVRHNIFHANKYEAMNNEPETQNELIKKCYLLLSSLLRSS